MFLIFMGLHSKLVVCVCITPSLLILILVYNLWSFQSMLDVDWAALLYLDEDDLDLGQYLSASFSLSSTSLL
jgi:hypothetical protein